MERNKLHSLRINYMSKYDNISSHQSSHQSSTTRLSSADSQLLMKSQRRQRVMTNQERSNLQSCFWGSSGRSPASIPSPEDGSSIHTAASNHSIELTEIPYAFPPPPKISVRSLCSLFSNSILLNGLFIYHSRTISLYTSQMDKQKQAICMNTQHNLSSRIPTRSPDTPPTLGIRNSTEGYGLIAIALHWIVALIVVGLFGLGVWMTGLTYYDDWYRRAPDLHKGIGTLLFLIMILRVVWRATNVAPDDESGISPLQLQAAHLVHLLLYLLLFVLMSSGYLISTADGRSIDVFGLFSLPAIVTDIPNQEDIAGAVHWYLALSLIGLAVLHALAALKHQFINRDRTLKKMLGIPPQPTDQP